MQKIIREVNGYKAVAKLFHDGADSIPWAAIWAFINSAVESEE